MENNCQSISMSVIILVLIKKYFKRNWKWNFHKDHWLKVNQWQPLSLQIISKWSHCQKSTFWRYFRINAYISRNMGSKIMWNTEPHLASPTAHPCQYPHFMLLDQLQETWQRFVFFCCPLDIWDFLHHLK